MAKNKWIYDTSSGLYHNTDYFMSLSVEEVVAYPYGEKLYEINGLRIDGKQLQISDRVTDPDVLHKIIKGAIGKVENG